MKKVVFLLGCVVCVIMIMGCASTQAVSTENAVTNIETVMQDTTDTLVVDDEKRAELDQTDSVLAVSSPGYYTPYDSYSIELEPGSYELEVISLGNMLGFNKSIMVPMIALLDENGKQISSKATVYEVRRNNMTLPIHIYSKWAFTSEKKQKAYVVVHADMSSTDKVVANGMGVFGAVPFNLTLPFSRSAYAKYHITPTMQ